VKDKPEIAVIMSACKRDHFEEQFKALSDQSVRPSVFYMYQNLPQYDLRDFCKKNKIIHIYSDKDFGCYGRFTVPLLVQAEYCLIIDDDTIPGPRWIENCLRCHKKYNAAVGSMGQRLPPVSIKQKAFIYQEGRYCVRKKEGEGLYEVEGLRQDHRVDYILHNYFFRKEWIKYFWSLDPLYYHIFEDFHFGITMALAGIPVYVAKQETLEEAGSIKWAYQYDEHRGMDRPLDDLQQIKKYYDYVWKKGWRPLCVREKGLIGRWLTSRALIDT